MNRWTWLLATLVGALLGVVATVAVDRLRGGPSGPAIRAYLLGHPEVVEEAITGMQAMQTARLIAGHRAEIETPYKGAWSGDAKADVSVVEYFDYNCGYCRANLPVLDRLLHDDPHVRLVYRELPILADTSLDAAKASLAAAAQGRYAAFHRALYAAGPVSAATITAAGRAARIDPTSVPADVDAELHGNRTAYATLGMNGTPSWVVGDRVLSGIQTLAALKAAIAAARAR